MEQQRQNNHFLGTKSPMSTPERPLLYEFQRNSNPSPVKSMTLEPEQHIYVELGSDIHTDFQPIQIPILVENSRMVTGGLVSSSNSSQSSGYYSGGGANSHVMPSSNAKTSQTINGNNNENVRNLDIQDSQII